MDDYFLNALETLQIKTGLLQYEKIKNNDEQVALLLSELVRATKRFGFLSDDTKQKVIDRNIMEDDGLKALTPAKVFQWLANYWNQLPQADKDKLINPKSITDHKPCDPEQAQKFIEQWKEEFSKIDYSYLQPKVTARRFYKDSTNQAVKVNQKVVACPGYGENPCLGAECPKCQGFGKIKEMVV